MRWRKKARGGTGGAFLDGTESSLSDFGETGGHGFAEAWDAHEDVEESEAPHGLFQPPDDKQSVRARDLDRRPWGRIVALGAIVVLGVGFAVAVQQGRFGSDRGEPEFLALPDTELTSIGDPRVYTDADGPNTVSGATPIDRLFTIVGDADPLPSERVDVAESAAFGRVMWGGRAHVAVAGNDVQLDSHCVVVSLVAADLQAVDLAAAGVCPEAYLGTGDRVACGGEHFVLLEVWPFDPDAVVEQLPVTDLRVRIETADDSAAITTSLRGAQNVGPSFIADLGSLDGQPGDEVDVRVGDRTSTCTLLDRTEVRVQLL